ncbi:hypothetical protein PYCC9005_002492 [Savitreella phatthalungensis]
MHLAVWIVLTALLGAVLAYFLLSGTGDSLGKVGQASGLSSLAPARPALLLLGPSGSGKTSLFLRLVHGHLPIKAPTHTSQSPNIADDVIISPASFAPVSAGGTTESQLEQDLDHLATGKAQKLRLIDVPGHAKVHDVALSAVLSGGQTRGVRAVLWVCDAAAASKDVSGSARDLVRAISVAQSAGNSPISRGGPGVPLVVLGNKADYFTALDGEALHDALTDEIKILRMSRRKGVRVEGITASSSAAQTESLGNDEDNLTGDAWLLDCADDANWTLKQDGISVVTGSLVEDALGDFSKAVLDAIDM